jgi:hypothetical protein
MVDEEEGCGKIFKNLVRKAIYILAILHTIPGTLPTN